MDEIDALVDWQLSNLPPTNYTCPACRTSTTVPIVMCDCGWVLISEPEKGENMKTAFVRTKHGTMVHRSTCTRVGGATSRALPWLWADSVPLAEVARAVRQFGYTTCRYCTPFE
jgi:hypothetical protein